MTFEQEIMTMLSRRKTAPTTKFIVDALMRPNHPEDAKEVSRALQQLIEQGKAICTNGLWVRRDSLLVDNRKPKGPKRLDPKSAEARTLPLEFYK